MKSLYKTLAISSILLFFAAQTPVAAVLTTGRALWSKAIGEQAYLEECYGVQKTSDGGYILAGRHSLSTAGAKSNTYFVKTDANGNTQWTKEIDPYPSYNSHSRLLDVVQANDGGYVAAGWVETETYGDEGYLVKIDSTGALVWHYIYGNVNLGSGDDDDWFWSIEKTADGGYILAGYTEALTADSLPDAWLVKVNSAGVIAWQKAHGPDSANEYAYDAFQTEDGGYILTGSTSAEEVFEIYDEAVFIVKTDASGDVQWYKTLDWAAYGNEAGESIRQTSDSGYIVGGWYETGSDPGIPFLAKLTSSGAAQWSKTYNLGSGSEVFSGLDIVTDGGYIAVGRTNSIGHGSYDALAIKTDSSGSQEWGETYGGSDYDAAYAVQQTGDGGAIIGGKAVGLQWAGGTDMYLIRIGQSSPPVYDHFVYLPLTLK